jgi:hypothetical protein
LTGSNGVNVQSRSGLAHPHSLRHCGSLLPPAPAPEAQRPSNCATPASGTNAKFLLNATVVHCLQPPFSTQSKTLGQAALSTVGAHCSRAAHSTGNRAPLTGPRLSAWRFTQPSYIHTCRPTASQEFTPTATTTALTATICRQIDTADKCHNRQQWYGFAALSSIASMLHISSIRLTETYGQLTELQVHILAA